MEKPIHIEARVREVMTPIYIFCGSMFLGAGLAFFPGTFALVFGSTLLVVSMAIMIYLSVRRQRDMRARGAMLTNEGIGATFDGNLVWLLPWNRFGGYRGTAYSDWYRTFHPEDDGVEILDKSGIKIGILNIHPESLYPGSSFRAEGRRLRAGAFWKELDARVPAGGPKYERRPVQSYKTNPQRARKQQIAGLILSPIGFVGMWMMVDGMKEDAAGTWVAIFANPIVATTSVLVVAVGLFELFLAWVSRSSLRMQEEKKQRELAPSDGPTYDEFLAAHLGLPLNTELREGVRYVQVDPERRRKKLKLGISWGLAGTIMFGCFYLSGFFVSPWFVLIMGVGYVPIILLYLYTWRKSARDLKTIDDVVIPSDGGIVIVKKDGSHLAFTANATKKEGSWVDRIFSGPVEIWSENGNRYRLTKGHLIESNLQVTDEIRRELAANSSLTDSATQTEEQRN